MFDEKQYMKEYYLKNRDKLIKKNSEYVKLNKDRINLYRKNRRKTDINYRLNYNKINRESAKRNKENRIVSNKLTREFGLKKIDNPSLYKTVFKFTKQYLDLKREINGFKNEKSIVFKCKHKDCDIKVTMFKGFCFKHDPIRIEKWKKYRIEYAINNREKKAEINRKYREKNRDKYNEYFREYNKKNKEKRKKWREDNKEKIKISRKKYYLKTKQQKEMKNERQQSLPV